MNIVRQNFGYNQPAHSGYFFADGAPVPDISLINGRASSTINMENNQLLQNELLNSENGAVVYLNTSSDKFTIEAAGALGYTISDQVGSIVAKGKGDGQMQIGKKLFLGLYFVLLKTDGGAKHFKIVKINR